MLSGFNGASTSTMHAWEGAGCRLPSRESTRRNPHFLRRMVNWGVSCQLSTVNVAEERDLGVPVLQFFHLVFYTIARWSTKYSVSIKLNPSIFRPGNPSGYGGGNPVTVLLPDNSSAISAKHASTSLF